MTRKIDILICQNNIKSEKCSERGDVIKDYTDQTYAFVDEFLEESMKSSSI
jgi:uncharacterized protein (UPF0371 family)